MIFLTGSTGFLGRHLLLRLMELRPSEEFSLLVRADNPQAAYSRIFDSLRDACSDEILAHAKERIRPICGDLRADRFGLDERSFNDLSKSLDDIYHCAATTTLDLPYETSWSINVGGTRQIANLTQLAKENGRNAWLHHVSTAYVAGDTDKVVNTKVELKSKFRNSYEQTKALAEEEVRKLHPDIATTIYRPSIIVGDSLTGRTSAFNVMYLPAKLLIKGVCKALPALPDTPFDVVPIDYVSNAIAQLSLQKQSQGQCFHVSAGLGRESSPLEVVEAFMGAVDRYKQRRPKHLSKIPFICPELISKTFFPISISAATSSMRQLEKLVTERIGVFKQLKPLIPYMLRNPRFDNSSTQRALDGLLAPAPLFSSYADTVFRYCFETNWGRKEAAPLK